MSRTLPLALFLCLIGLFGFGIWWNAGHDPREVPSPLIGKSAPPFTLPSLADPPRLIREASMRGAPYVLNVFASWCIACGEEHPVLMARYADLGAPLVGYSYKDATSDAKSWLDNHGDPYRLVLVDQEGRTALDLGIYGAPETFVFDAQGILRLKHIGPLSDDVIDHQIKPLIASLRGRKS